VIFSFFAEPYRSRRVSRQRRACFGVAMKVIITIIALNASLGLTFGDGRRKENCVEGNAGN
jgi:hypothetical protein